MIWFGDQRILCAQQWFKTLRQFLREGPYRLFAFANVNAPYRGLLGFGIGDHLWRCGAARNWYAV